MAGTKVSIFFEQPRGKTVDGVFVPSGFSGWTEHYYLTGTPSVISKVLVANFIAARMALCSKQTYTTKYRLAAVDPAGKTITIKHIVYGSQNLVCDNVEQSLSWSVRGEGVSNRRTITLRGIPDARVEGGTYNKLESYDNIIRAFFSNFKTNGFRFRGKVMTGASARIQSISAEGALVLRDDLALASGKEVQILRSYAAGHRAKGIITNLAAKTDARHFTLAVWPYGAASGGRVRETKDVDYFPIEITDGEMIVPEVRERQTGSPPAKSRGRRSAKYA